MLLELANQLVARAYATRHNDNRLDDVASCLVRGGDDGALRDRIVARFDQTIVYADLATMRAEPWPEDLRAQMAKFAGVAS